MLVLFKDLKQGDMIICDGVLFSINKPQVHVFKGRDDVITVRAKFIERRKINLQTLFNKRKICNFDLEQGLNLQGCRNDKIEVFKHGTLQPRL